MDKNIKIVLIHHPTNNSGVDPLTLTISQSHNSAIHRITGANTSVDLHTFADLAQLKNISNIDFYILLPNIETDVNQALSYLSSFKEKSIVIFKSEAENRKHAANLAGYSFINLYDTEYISHRGRTYSPDIQGNESRLFWLKMLDLASDIASKLDAKQANATLYINECPNDVVEFGDALVRNLKSFHFSIIPERILGNKNINGDELGKIFSTTQLNIFIVGNQAGSDTLTHLWKANIMHAVKNKDSRNIVWIPFGMKIEDRQTIQLLDDLQNNYKHNTEQVQMPFDDLLRLVHERLHIGEFKEVFAKKLQFDHSVYIIHDVKDNAAVRGLSNSLKEKKITPLFIDFEENRFDFVEEHRDYLSKADAVMIYDNNCAKRWIDSKLRDLVKSPGYGRSKPLQSKSILTLNPDQIKTFKQIDNTFQIAKLTDGIGTIDFKVN